MKIATMHEVRWFDGRRVPYPALNIHVLSGGVTSPKFRTIVDTGAIATLLPWSVAETLRIADAAKSAPWKRFDGLGGSGIGRRMVVDLLLPGKNLLRETVVYFLEGTRSIAGADGLLGQLGFFDRLKLVQLSKARTPGPTPKPDDPAYFILESYVGR